jgi:DNA polymerase-3 subunit delta
MITVLTGENTFEVSRALDSIVADFSGIVERVDGTEVEVKNLPDLFMGVTLFAPTRLVVIKNLSLNKSVWGVLDVWLSRVSDDVQVVLVEPKLDKRTKTYKELMKHAEVRDFALWTDRDAPRAEKWASDEAKTLGFALDTKSARILVARVGVDQWLLYQALQKLSVLGAVTSDIIKEVIDANPTENVFNLFEAALKGNASGVAEMIKVLSLAEDPFRLFGLLSGQAFQLAVLANTDRPTNEVVKDIGAHPFALGKLVPYAKKMGRPGVRTVIAAFTEADRGIKTSAGDPWMLIERALIKTAQI